MKDLYCSIIHSGLELNFKGKNATANSCCLRKDKFPIDTTTNFWNDQQFAPLRNINKQNVWAPGCENCQSLESVGQESFRTGMNNGLVGSRLDVVGPKRIDLMFDISCNLACRTCGPHSSSYWQKHLNDHNEWNRPVATLQQHDDVVSALEKLDLSDLQMLVFCGGETLLGQSYWNVASWLANNVNSKQLTLCFQTNGTQPIHPKNYELISKFHLVKLHVSLDGIGNRFEYLRWPASWNQVVDNLMSIQDTAPSNLMFHVEETVSIFNLYYLQELEHWAANNFSANREGDVTNHGKHLASGTFNLSYCTQEYVDAMQGQSYKNLIPKNWKESPLDITRMMGTIKKFDSFRKQSFEQTFPEVSQFYARYL